jgi:hypothetical protein
MNQSIDLVSLFVGIVYVTFGVWVVGDIVGSPPPLVIVLPTVGIGAVVASLVMVNRHRARH